MSRIVVTEQYLMSLSNELKAAMDHLKQVDSKVQRSLHAIPWESQNRGEILSMYGSYQQKLRIANEQLTALSKFVDTTKENFIKADQSFLGMKGFNGMAPIDGLGNTFGTVTGALAVAHVGYKVTKDGYKVVKQLDRHRPRILVREDHQSAAHQKRMKGREHKIYYVDQINKQLANGTADAKTREVAAMIKPGSAVKMALKDKLGWASVAIDTYNDTSDNIKSGASGDKIAGDIMGNVAVGAATTVGAAALTVAILPAAVPALGIAAAGFAVSVGATYIAEGIKWDVDTNGDGEDDTIKDMVKTGAQKVCSTVAGWFK
ncbi:hypothetical protein MUG87_11730 [Ectobacillus sp. JY-23]|uniref:hypothetical protein n=1 Tax=Ectobacillus sp. JY-23 TaxID=2933872 RepID=UPI001FF38BE3|nr:hypothetical protein [Ectobacillus sp. JY-23]UOY91225.1 hypothetical protein MUG87_11730 [Ectobacillus sp. JY-23]